MFSWNNIIIPTITVEEKRFDSHTNKTKSIPCEILQLCLVDTTAACLPRDHSFKTVRANVHLLAHSQTHIACGQLWSWCTGRTWGRQEWCSLG